MLISVPACGRERVEVGVELAVGVHLHLADHVGGRDVEDLVGVDTLEVGVGHDQGRKRDRLGVGHRVMRRRLLVGRRAVLAERQADRLALAEERVVDRLEERLVHRRPGGHDVPDRLVGIGRTGISRVVEVGRDQLVDPRADRAERVGVLEAREMPQLVRGDRDRQRDEVGAVGRRLAGLAQQIGDVDPRPVRGRDVQPRGVQDRRARDVQVAPVDLASRCPPPAPSAPGR